MSAADAYSILETIAQINGLENHLVLVEPSAKQIKDEVEAEKIRIKRTSLPKLDWMIGQGLIKPGDKICVISHPNEVATLVDDNNVEYRDELMTTNKFGCLVTDWRAIQIYSTMRLINNNKTLGEMRKEKMRELGMIE